MSSNFNYKSIIQQLSIGIFIIVIIYVVYAFFKFQRSIIEGMQSGTGSNSEVYAEDIKSKTMKLQDSLLISKYKKDYEDIIINMEEYLNLTLVKELLNIKLDSKNMNESLQNINTITNSKNNLNDIMQFIDKIK